MVKDILLKLNGLLDQYQLKTIVAKKSSCVMTQIFRVMDFSTPMLTDDKSYSVKEIIDRPIITLSMRVLAVTIIQLQVVFGLKIIKDN